MMCKSTERLPQNSSNKAIEQEGKDWFSCIIFQKPRKKIPIDLKPPSAYFF